MATGVNRVILVGNLGRDPEVRYVQSGNAVCTMSIACTERRKDGDNWKDHTEWMKVVTFGKTAENAGQYLAKGRQVYVEGRLQTRQYKDKDGVEKYATEVVAHTVLFLGGKDDGAPRAPRDDSKKNHRAPAPAASSGPPDDGFIDDELPF